MGFNNVIDIFIFLLLVWLVYLQFGPVKGLKTLKEAEFREQLEQHRKRVLIDVREAHERAGGTIPGTKHIPLSALNKRLGDIPQDSEIFLYCTSGSRSKRAARVLRSKGFVKLHHLRGGIKAWSGKLVKP